MLDVQFDATRAIVKIDGWPSKLQAAIHQKAIALRLQLEDRVKQKLSGEVLNVVTGALRRSIFGDETVTSTSVVERVASSSDVKYAGIHEFGGKTPAHDIIPTKAQALHFIGKDGKDVFAKIVHHPGSVMPERSFLRSSLAEMIPDIRAELQEAAREGVRE